MGTNLSDIVSLVALIAALLPLLPLVKLLLFGDKVNGGWLGITALSISFVLSGFVFFNTWNTRLIHFSVEWFSIGTYSFKAGILLNNLSVLMLLLVSGISLLVHIYSAAYMKYDALIQRYWAYLGLFCFAMLALVIADNLLLIYIFWELIGFSSYLLIGFWFTKETATLAAKKAFIINRIGDIGFLIGIFIILTQFHTLDIQELFSSNGLIKQATVRNGLWMNGEIALPMIWLTVAGLSFALASFSKSAQFPLHTWLPDAMEGPTSVSALIHAATMVAAGIFLLARIFPLLDSNTLLVITAIGTVTAITAAMVALVQNDIKKILAFSTISQLGFMMIALGIGVYNISIFHLVTHAFFKCLLFLVAGIIIHQLHHAAEKAQLEFDCQDIRNMGGLRKKMPITFYTALFAAAALIGLPFTSGYLSKDAILIKTFEWAEGRAFIFQLVPYLSILASWCTAFYISRLIVNVFFGDLRIEKILNTSLIVQDGDKKMTYPLVVLSGFCVFIFFSFNPLLFEDAWIMKGFILNDNLQRVNLYHTVVPAAVNVINSAVILVAWRIYKDGERQLLPEKTFLYKFAFNQGYLNPLYHKVLVLPIVEIAKGAYFIDAYIIDGLVNLVSRVGVVFASVCAWLDQFVVDGIVNSAASFTAYIGNISRKFQTGKLQHYFLAMLTISATIFILMYLSKTI